MKNLLILAMMIAVFAACNPSSNTGADAVTKANTYEGANIDDYELENVDGTNWQKATKRDAEGNMLEVGYFENGKKVGSWLSYQAGELFPRLLSNYENGKLNGIHMQFGQGGQVEMVAYYQNGNLHGPYAKYRFARVLEESNYVNGNLDGAYNIYNIRDGKINTSAEYKNGVQDGYYRTYGPEGEVLTEYVYKNGEKVSGGAVNQ